MADFTLDTSGSVTLPDGRVMTWETLPNDFVRGYIEAGLSEQPFKWTSTGSPAHTVTIGYSDLAPATLAQMIADCERFNALIGDASHNKGIGATFWASRQIGFSKHWSLHHVEFATAFPPLTITLGDDGLIYMREAGMTDPAFIDITPSLGGYAVWIDDRRLVTDVTEAEARKAYRAALELAAEARTQLTRTLERTV